MREKILIAGYGSIGRRKHALFASELGLKTYVLTNYPDDNKSVIFIKDPAEIEGLGFCIIATPTYKHLLDLQKIHEGTGCKNFLIEKPVEVTKESALELYEYAVLKKINVRVGYSQRFLNVFEKIKTVVKKEINNIRLVEIVAGNYLPNWRFNSDYRVSYSSKKEMGGGVHLDLSHEPDYLFWLFGYPTETLLKHRDKLSDLEINSVDYFHGIYKYDKFIADITLDYFRKNERFLRIIGENDVILKCDFVQNRIFYRDDDVTEQNLFNSPENYKNQLKDFISKDNSKLASLEESIRLYDYI